MFSGGQQNSSDSLLPDNPGVQIEPVQGGGGHSNTYKNKWLSEPVKIDPVNEFNLTTNTGILKKYQARWRQTLGPSVPSRKKPRQDPHIIIGSLNIFDCPTYITAPFRGDKDKASIVFAWADELLESNSESHIVFVGPLMGRQSNTYIKNGITSLLTKYPGHVIYVSDKETELPSLDGLLLNAVPETSKQIAIGFIPDHENVYNRSSRSLDCLKVDTLKVPFSKANEHDDDCSIHYITFDTPTRIEESVKDFEHKIISNNITLKAISGWVTKISFGSPSIEQEGGSAVVAPVKMAINPPIKDNEIEVRLGDSPPFIIRKDAKDAWGKGEFTLAEKALLEHEGLQYSNLVYSKFFEGLVNTRCNTEGETWLSPECRIFRYIMADKYYRNVKAMTNGKQALNTTGESNVMPPGVVPPSPIPAPSPPGSISSSSSTLTPTSSDTVTLTALLLLLLLPLLHLPPLLFRPPLLHLRPLPLEASPPKAHPPQAAL